MALTESVLAPFRDPSVWGETDCINWVEAITGLTVPPWSVWRSDIRSEAQALVRVRRIHGTYEKAVIHWLRRHGYRRLDSVPAYMHFGDVAIVDHPIYGPSIGGIAPGCGILIRHPGGLAPGSGPIRHYLSL